MSDQFVAEIRIFPFNFPPTGWAFCNGQLLPISQNTALFSLIGTFYGGDGKSTFALPNLQGAAPMQTGQGQALTERFLGETGGVEAITLLSTEMPFHNHQMMAVPADATVASPAGALLSHGKWKFQGNGGDIAAYTTAQPDSTMDFQTLAVVGGNQPHSNLQPYLTLNYCIALQGIFPPRP